ncbi:cysteine/serine endopeptidase inhibitor [Actinoplanes sp. TFC3]|uniref:cysteine/serine endopeptidase inhibitor n=1 Tax=Actinoplanes sp. TFC3 TaxID=1710355 RepID=UPI0008308573|nr:cysteine/serine endopeptidase inhibitor [Actinoplanes sp. TFC3]
MFSVRKAVLSVAAGLTAVLALAAPAAAAIPIGQVQNGKATYYNDAGYGACGTPINAATEMLVAVSYQWWTTANPNADPLCSGISVQVTYNGKTITVPVKDKCPGCDATHIDLSQPAFGQFASTDPSNTPGVLNVTWKFVSSTGGGDNPPPSGPTGATGPITGLANKCIGAAGGATGNGTAIDLYSCVGDATQQWTRATDGTIRTGGKCMDVSGSGNANGTKVQVWDCNGTGAQQWVYTSARDLVNPQSNKCLDLANNSSADFTKTQIWTCTGAPNQKWTAPV